MTSESNVLAQIEVCCSHYGICVLPRNPKKLSVSVWSMPDPKYHVGVIWRQNTGALKAETRFVRFGLPGEADFQGWLFGSGQRFGIEAKSASGRISADQSIYGDLLVKTGGLWGVARSYDECAKLLESWGLKLSSLSASSRLGKLELDIEKATKE